MFGRAKRFEEQKLCGPPPGSYDPKQEDGVVRGPTSFPKAGRFRELTATPAAAAGVDGVGDKSQTPVIRRATMRTVLPSTPAPSTPLKSSSSLGDLVNIHPDKEEVKRLLAEQKKLMAQLKAKDEQLKAVQAEMEALAVEEAQHKLTQQTRTADVDLLRHTVSIFEQQKDELATSLQSSNSHNEAVEVENSQLHDMLSELRQEIEVMSSEQCKLETSYKTCQHDLTAALQQSENRSLKAGQVSKLEEERDSLLQQCKALSQQLDDVTRQLQVQVQQTLTLTGQNAACQLRIQALEEALRLEQDKLRATESQLSTEKSTSRQRQQLVKSLDLQVETLMESHGKALSHNENRILDLEASTLQYQLDLKASEETTVELQGQRDCQREEIQRLEQCLEEERAAHCAYRTDVTAQTCKQEVLINELEEAHGKTATEMTALHCQVEESKAHALEAERRLDEAGREMRCLEAKCEDHMRQIDSLSGDKSMLQQSMQQAAEDSYLKVAQLEEQLSNTNTDINRLESTLEEWEDRCQQEKADAEEKAQRVNQELSRRVIEAEKRLVQSQSDHHSAQVELQEKLSTLEEQLEGAVLAQEESGDAEKWRLAYETLREQCAPFTAQLEMFSAERRLLQSQTALAKTEVEDLNRRYGELLGHQNQKQKIKHIMSIKEENLSMKQELMKLREQCDRQRRTIRQHEEKSRVSSFMASRQTLTSHEISASGFQKVATRPAGLAPQKENKKPAAFR